MNQKQFIWEVKSVEGQPRQIEMIGSTEDFDRVGDKMIMAGCDLSNYLKNPIILQNHDYHKPAIGKAIDINVLNNQLIFKIEFADTPDGNEWLYLYSNKFMNASSVGFIGEDYEPNDQGGLTFNKWQLLELSLCTVPCNPNAIQRSYEEKKISKKLFETIIGKEDEQEVKLNETDKKAVNDMIAMCQKTIELLNAQNDKKTEEQKNLEKIKDIESKMKTAKEQSDKILKAKAGATLSAQTVDALTAIAEQISASAGALVEFVESATGVDIPDDEPEEEDPEDTDPEDTEKEYSNEELIKEFLSKLGGNK